MAKGPKSFVLSIRIGFSEENLKKILLKEDLFYSGWSHLRILPFILFEDKMIQKKYGWWQKKDKPFMSQAISNFYSHIQNAFLPYHFFVIHPEWAGSRYFVPKFLWSNRLSKKEMFQLARFFQSHLIMIGKVTLRESDAESFLNMKVQLSVFNTDSGRLLAEVERFEKLPKGESKDKVQINRYNAVSLFLKRKTGFAKSLGAQLQLIYEEGLLSSHITQIRINNTLRHVDLERFKKKLISKTPAITDLQEHIISQNSLTYIVSADKDIKELTNQIQSAKWSDFDVKVTNQKKNQLVLKVSLKQ